MPFLSQLRKRLKMSPSPPKSSSIKLPDPAIRKDHPPDIDYGAVIETKHKAFVLHTMRYEGNESVVSALLMHKYEIYVPEIAIRKYQKQDKHEAKITGWGWESCGMILLISRQIRGNEETFDEIVNFMPENPEVGSNDFRFPITYADNWLKDPRFAGVRDAYAKVDIPDEKNLLWKAWDAVTAFRRRCGETDHPDPLVPDPKRFSIIGADPELKSWHNFEQAPYPKVLDRVNFDAEGGTH